MSGYLIESINYISIQRLKLMSMNGLWADKMWFEGFHTIVKKKACYSSF
jgi:hypothetical protein